MESNSEEFYKQKYLKYKHKYLEAQKLYGEELEGGGTLKWLVVPSNIYLHNIKSLVEAGKYSKDASLYLLAGKKAVVIEPKSKSVLNSWNEKQLEVQINEGNGLGVKDKKYTDDEALKQLKEAYPEHAYILIESNTFSSGGDFKKVFLE